jgi:hypothetical protein
MANRKWDGFAASRSDDDGRGLFSRQVLEKVGMQCEGILRKYIIHPNISDVPSDSYIFAIVK